MIGFIKGKVINKKPTKILIDVNGVGYLLNISINTFEKINEQEEISLYTHLHVREDQLELFGFYTEAEKEMFELLISVSGIGPKMAQTILSGVRPEELIRTIAHSALSSLTAIPGIGKKTAERLIVELKDKVTKIEETEKIIDLPTSSSSIRHEALNALISLGYSREKGEQALRTVINELNGKIITLEELIKRALQVR